MNQQIMINMETHQANNKIHRQRMNKNIHMIKHLLSDENPILKIITESRENCGPVKKGEQKEALGDMIKKNILSKWMVPTDFPLADCDIHFESQ